jgi:hypothetical protein
MNYGKLKLNWQQMSKDRDHQTTSAKVHLTSGLLYLSLRYLIIDRIRPADN